MKKNLILSLFTAESADNTIAVSDGDTISILDDLDKGRFPIRLDKIDAPEKKQSLPANRKNEKQSKPEPREKDYG